MDPKFLAEFEGFYQKGISQWDEDMVKRMRVTYTEEQLREIFMYDFQREKNKPKLEIKLEPQAINYDVVEYYLPEKWEMDNGFLLLSERDRYDAWKILTYNFGLNKMLDTLPCELIEEYLQKRLRNEHE
ncbi:hypothetical protein [Metabacillus schmidteae]|uniref:hypothetical protein n=1 Tax=Metabacillus schmidteae TaxID=2730405 RepID=UPI00158D5F47|nr:hypothetical protein [Metabacillus schmidteae]